MGQHLASAPDSTARPGICQPNQLPPNQQRIHLVEVKYCEDTRPENHLEAVKQQHRELCQLIHDHGAIALITLDTIMLGVGGIIFRPLQKLGLTLTKLSRLP